MGDVKPQREEFEDWAYCGEYTQYTEEDDGGWRMSTLVASTLGFVIGAWLMGSC